MKNKIKLCLDARMINHSGIGTYIKMLLPFLCKEYDVVLLGNSELLHGFAASATIIPFDSPIYSINEQINFTKVIPAVDLFWSPHFNVPLSRINAKKRLVTIHDVFHLAFAAELTLKQRLYAKFVINRSIRINDRVITVSDFSKQEIVQFTSADPSKIEVIYNGVRQYKTVKKISDVRKSYNLPDKYILFVGNVKPHKNLTGLLNAFLRLPDHIRNVYRIVIVGKASGFITGDDQLFKMINDNVILRDNILFTGFVEDEDMDTIYSAASLLILPSLYEGFGLPPLEAMLNHCPVITSERSSLPEVCGNAALYFNPDNDSELSCKIVRILTDRNLSAKLILEGTSRIKQFAWATSATRHIQLINKICTQ